MFLRVVPFCVLLSQPDCWNSIQFIVWVTYYETSHQLTASTVVSTEERCTAHKLTKQLALTPPSSESYENAGQNASLVSHDFRGIRVTAVPCKFRPRKRSRVTGAKLAGITGPRMTTER